MPTILKLATPSMFNSFLLDYDMHYSNRLFLDTLTPPPPHSLHQNQSHTHAHTHTHTHSHIFTSHTHTFYITHITHTLIIIRHQSHSHHTSHIIIRTVTLSQHTWTNTHTHKHTHTHNSDNTCMLSHMHTGGGKLRQGVHARGRYNMNVPNWPCVIRGHALPLPLPLPPPHQKKRRDERKNMKRKTGRG